MANSPLAASDADSEDWVGERSGTRIRALLARTRPLSGNEVPNVYWEGRSLVESLALSFDVGSDYGWEPAQCATVLEFLGCIEPTAGNCFCNDPSDVNATCGFHVILNFMAEEIRRFASKAKGRKRTVEVLGKRKVPRGRLKH